MNDSMQNAGSGTATSTQRSITAWAELRFRFDPLDLSAVAFKTLQEGGIEALYQGLLPRVLCCHFAATELWANLAVVLTERQRGLNRIETLLDCASSSLADLFLSCATISTILGDQARAQRMLRAAIAFGGAVPETRSHLLYAMLISPSPSAYVENLGKDWSQGDLATYSAVCRAASILERFQASLTTLRMDWARAKQLASEINWATESAAGTTIDIFRTVAVIAAESLERWRATTRRRLLPEERKDFSRTLFSLYCAQLVHQKEDLTAYRSLWRTFVLVKRAPALISNYEERLGLSRWLASELRRLARKLSSPPHTEEAVLGSEFFAAWGHASLTLALGTSDSEAATSNLQEAIHAFEFSQRSPIPIPPGIKSESYFKLGISWLALALETRRNGGGELKIKEQTTAAESSFAKAAEVWEPCGDLIHHRPTATSNNIGIHLHMAAAAIVAGDHLRATQHACLELLGTTEGGRGDLCATLDIESLPYLLTRAEGLDGVKAVVQNARKLFPDSLWLLRRHAHLHWRAQTEGSMDSSKSIADELVNRLRKQEPGSAISERQWELLTIRSSMERYLVSCRESLVKGSAAHLLRDFSGLLIGAKLLSLDGQTDDDVLLTFQAEALRTVGNLAGARKVLDKAYCASSTPRARGEVWAQRGEVLLLERSYLQAAEAFQLSYVEGGRESFGPLFSASKALALAQEFDRAILLIKSIAASGRDASPIKSRTALARLLWAQYQSAHAGEANEAVGQACELLAPILCGQAGYPGDAYAAEALVAMAQHPISRKLVIDLLRNGPPAAKLIILRKLEQYERFDREIVNAVIEELPTLSSLDRGSFAVADFLMGAWVDCYFRCAREEFIDILSETVSGILRADATQSFWSLLLASNKGLMRGRLVNLARTRTRAIIEELSAATGAEMLAKVSKELQANLIAKLDTGLLQITPQNYGGNEIEESQARALPERIGIPLMRRLSIVFRRHLEVATTETHGIAGELLDAHGNDMLVSELQAFWVGRFFSRILETAESTFFKSTVRGFSIELNPGERVGRVLMRLLLRQPASLEEVQELATNLSSLEVFRYWTEATAAFCPAPIALSCDVGGQSVVVSVSLWCSKEVDTHLKEWIRFYDYVVNQTWGSTDLGPTYYSTAFQLTPPVSVADTTALSGYIHSQLDGMFSKVYLAEHDALRRVSHSVRGVLAQGATPNEKTAVELLQIHRQILSSIASDEGSRDFDLGVLLEEVRQRGETLRPDVCWRLSGAAPDQLLVLYGNRSLLRRAFWDIIANALAAIDTPMGATIPPEILFDLVADSSGFTVTILNTGQPEPTPGGFGIGTSTIVFAAKHHGGNFDRGPVDNRPPYRFAAHLMLPAGGMGGAFTI